MKTEAGDVPPPGAGFVTATSTLPAVATSLAGMAAEILVALTNVVNSALPLKLTTDFDWKFAPFTVRVKAAPPAMWVVPRLEIVGAGLFELPIVNTFGDDAPVVGAGFVTLTFAEPAVSISDARIAAVTDVLLTNVVVRFAPLNCTVAPFTNWLPVTVNVNAADPAVALEGDREETVGGALLIVKDAALDVPPPGAGFVTVTFGVPAVNISEVAMAAVNWLALLKVVVLVDPLNLTTEPDTKPEPFTVKVKAAPPAVVLVGESDVIPTVGLLIVNCTLAEAPPPGAGFVTETFAVPAVAISAAAMAAVNWVALWNVVVLETPLNFTIDVERKPVPFTVNVNPAPPSVALVGEMDVAAGAGLLTEKT